MERASGAERARNDSTGTPGVADRPSSHWLDGELLLFQPASGGLFRLNTAGAFIWCCVSEGMDSRATAQALADTFRISRDRALQDVHTALSDWQAQGLWGGENTVEGYRTAPSQCDSPPEYRTLAPVPQAEREFHIRLLDTCFRVCLADQKMAAWLLPGLRHLLLQSTAAADITLTLGKTQDGYLLWCNERVAAHCYALEELAPLLQGEMLARSYARADCLLAMHAAVVEKNGGSLLFPGCSGYGKSTLTAALVGAGFRYGTDELALLSHDRHTLRAAAIGIGVKEGAWPVLAPWHPELVLLPVHRRADGRLVRYLSPRQALLPDTPTPALRAVVLPRYQPGVRVCLTPVPRAEAMCRIAAAGYAVGTGLDSDKVDQIVNWISGLNCYELVFDELSEAVQTVESLL